MTKLDPAELTYNADGMLIATYGDDRGTPELAQRIPIIGTTTNEGRETRRVHKTQDLLDRMWAKNTITEAQHKAGAKFRDAFYVANINPTACTNFERVSKGTAGALGATERAVDARRRIQGAMDVLGGHTSPAANAAWHCLGNGMTIKAWASRESGVGLKSKINQHTAKGILIAALGVLASHWGC